MAKSPDARFTGGHEQAYALAAAIDGTLDPKLRRRADALIRKQPWESM